MGKRDLITKDFALYVVHHFASMQTWSKQDILAEIDKKIKEADEDVVRCKACAVPHNQWTGCPKLNGLVPPPDFYCAYGEREIMDNTREKLIKLIGCTDFSPVSGAVTTIGSRFTTAFIEVIADHLIANGVTLQKVITVEGYKMFAGTMRICWQHPECPPQEIYGDWLYRPDTGYWYCDGKSYLADNCTIVEKP